MDLTVYILRNGQFSIFEKKKKKKKKGAILWQQFFFSHTCPDLEITKNQAWKLMLNSESSKTDCKLIFLTGRHKSINMMFSRFDVTHTKKQQYTKTQIYIFIDTSFLCWEF